MKRRLNTAGRMTALLILMAIVMSGTVFMRSEAEEAEEEITYPALYVTATQLNGRGRPSRKAQVEAIFDYGDELEPTGRWSQDHQWVEVVGGETGTVWVSCKYISERFWPFIVINENNGRIRIWSKPGGDGKLIGYVGHGKSIEIDQVIMGWGHCGRGWVDLEYFIEEVW